MNTLDSTATSGQASSPDPKAPLKGAPLSAWWMLTVVFLLYVVSVVDRNILSMLVPSIQADLHISDAEMGLLLGPAFSFFYAAFGIPLGWAADRYPRRWVIFIGAMMFGAATFASATAATFIALFVLRACVGVGEASLSPAAYSMMADKFPRHLLTTASSIYSSASKVGIAAAYTIGGVVIGLTAGLTIVAPLVGSVQPWRLVLAMTGLPAILFGLLVFTFREPPRSQDRGAAGQNKAALVPFLTTQWRLMLPMIFGFGLIATCSFGLSAWVPTYLSRHYDLVPLHYGPILGFISMAAAATLLVKGVIVDWFYSRGVKDIHIRFYTWILAACLPIAGLMFFVNNALLFMIMYGIVQVVAMPLLIYMSATIALIVPPSLRGQVIAVVLFVISIMGSGLGPLIVGFLTDYLFHNDSSLGSSLAIVVFATLPTALVCLRWALKPLRLAVVDSELAFSAPSASGSANPRPDESAE